MKAGKLPVELLTDLLDGIKINDPRVVLGPKTGEDAALIDFGDRYLVAKTDPITFATDLIGWYVVQINANDLAVMGATPRWLMATAMMPEGTEAEQVREVFSQLTSACKELGITLIGGHTEITYGIDRPLAVGAMLGEVDKDRVVLTSGARPGDSIVITKGIAVEGTAILAREASNELAAKGVAADVIDRAAEFLFSPGISVVRDASIAVDAVSVHAMHDPTEGGLVGGLLEMALGAGVGLEIDRDRIPVLPETKSICDALGLDPLGLIASGSLLAAVAREDVATLISTLGDSGIPAFEIGRIADGSHGLRMLTGHGEAALPRFERDELARFFGNDDSS
ncbi:MAG: AIR synthase family protein [SAR202 cluster bacterium]|jgi:hydrogenase maturation factor|nr:AIR synthase family protein [SAR202 cluster bacterium]MDP6800917.1 AIR synthase family protein [SAR202 cluster bacterium]